MRPDRVHEDDPAWSAQRDALARQVLRWTGNHAGIAEVAERELPGLLTAGRPIVGELRRDAVTLHGARIERLLGAS